MSMNMVLQIEDKFFLYIMPYFTKPLNALS